MKKIAIIAVSVAGTKIAREIAKEIPDGKTLADIVSTRKGAGIKTVKSIGVFTAENFGKYDGFIFIGALGICVRCIAPNIKNKKTDPAVVNVSEDKLFAQSVLSGHEGGANKLAEKTAKIIGAEPVITTATETRPKSLFVGLGSQKGVEPDDFIKSFEKEMKARGFSLFEVAVIASAKIKESEPAFAALAEKLKIPFRVYDEKHLAKIPKPNPSAIVKKKTGTDGVCEPAALAVSGAKKLIVEKTKTTLPSGKKYTFAVAENPRPSLVAIVGAGPGDPRLITVEGRDLIRRADLILYAGSLVPENLIKNVKPSATVKNSAVMTLETQTKLMEKFYKKGALIVRLHSGDPSIYGATREQMEILDKKKMEYVIVPGVSSFQAAAARLETEFTAPEISQSIILTRGEGKTPMPKGEKLSEMAKHRATMCIFLSAKMGRKVQNQLLEHYSPETPVAILYRATWEDERIWRGELKDLADIIRENKLTRTVLIVVGDALAKSGTRSRLYHPQWRHLFRAEKKKELRTPDIMVFGGTTEGKKAAAALDKQKTRYFYSTKTKTDFQPSEFCEYIHGDLNGKSLPQFAKKNKIKLIINAAHPFARHLHATVSEMSRKMEIPVIRFERKYPQRINHRLVCYCESYADAVKKLKNRKGARLILSGVQTLEELKPLWENGCVCYARILPRETSVAVAEKAGFPKNRLVMEMPHRDIKKEKMFFEKLKIKSVVTKESGNSGGQNAKIKAAIETGVKIAVIKRPVKPLFNRAVSSEKDLIRAVREIKNVS
ncbi:precorrin-4 C(11)-methyltransferase [Candidatus Mycalebacterium sp.]